ncbi:MAG: hypothetical protein LBF97_00270, partial [Elusimicrobiota bacterium]|nr:hypothetical protein [Elusimicrobiota bacterium]
INNDKKHKINSRLYEKLKIEYSNINSEKFKGENNYFYDKHYFGKKNHKSKPVYCYELDMEFESARQAALFLGKNGTSSGPSILICAKGELKNKRKLNTCFKHPENNKGLHWCLLEDKENFLLKKDFFDNYNTLKERSKRISESKKNKCSGENNSMYGKKHTEETKEKIRQKQLERNNK